MARHPSHDKSGSSGFIRHVILVVVALLFIQFYFGVDVYGWLLSWGPLFDQYLIQPIASLF